MVHLVNLSMPEGVERNELLSEYCVQTGLTLRKAEEHLQLLEDTSKLRWEDLRLFTTPAGLRWIGYLRDHDGQLLDEREREEEVYRERARTNAQKASADIPSDDVDPGRSS